MREIEQKKKQGINIFKRFWNPSIVSPFLDILGCLVPKSLKENVKEKMKKKSKRKEKSEEK